MKKFVFFAFLLANSAFSAASSSQESTLSALVNLYRSDFGMFKYTVFSPLRDEKEDDRIHVPQPTYTIIHNNEEFERFDDHETHHSNGKRLFLRNPQHTKTKKSPTLEAYNPEINRHYWLENAKKIPIGYTIYLPENHFKAIVVNVYGGGVLDGTVGEKPKAASKHTPGKISNIARILLQNNIALVYLNLVDLLTDTHQKHLSPPEENLIHLSIHHFYDVLKNNPTSLHPDFAPHPEIPLFLKGSSWGARTAIMHAKRYPGTFNVICHAGPLDYTTAYAPETLIEYTTKNPDFSSLFPDPTEKIEDPILLLHNFNDTNVPVDSTLSWYEKTGFNPMITLYISPIGNKTPNFTTGHFRGHYEPETKKAMSAYSKAILNFVYNPTCSYAHDYDRYKIHAKAKSNKHTPSPEISFLSHALECYQNDLHRWDEKYLPLWYIEVFMAYESLLPEKNINTEALMNMLKYDLPLFLIYAQEKLPYTHIPETDDFIMRLASAIIDEKTAYVTTRSYFMGNPDQINIIKEQLMSNPEIKAMMDDSARIKDLLEQHIESKTKARTQKLLSLRHSQSSLERLKQLHNHTSTSSRSADSYFS